MMLHRVFRRLIYSLSILWGVATLMFVIFYLLPADPARMMTDQREDIQQLNALRLQYGLNLPVYHQYGLYLNDLLPVSYINEGSEIPLLKARERNLSYIKLFSLGQEKKVVLKWPHLRQSYQLKGVEVSSVIRSRFKNTLILAISAFFLSITTGIALGLIAAIFQHSAIDKWITILSTSGMGVPSFVSAILAAWIFAFLLHSYTGLNITGNLWEWDDLGESRHLRLKNLILPAITLGIRPLSIVTQMMRSAYLDQSGMPYVLTAKSKGLKQRQIILRHILPNALNPVVSVASSWMATMLAGSVFVEYIFGWNGIGKLVVESANTLDFPVLMGCVLSFSLIFILVNMATDLIYRWLDPTITYNQ